MTQTPDEWLPGCRSFIMIIFYSLSAFLFCHCNGLSPPIYQPIHLFLKYSLKKFKKILAFSYKTVMTRGIGVVVQQSKLVVYILMTVLTNGVYPAGESFITSVSKALIGQDWAHLTQGVLWMPHKYCNELKIRLSRKVFHLYQSPWWWCLRIGRQCNCPLDIELDNSNTGTSIDAIVLAKCEKKVIFEVDVGQQFGQIPLLVKSSYFFSPFDFAERCDFSNITASALTGKEESNTAIVF